MHILHLSSELHPYSKTGGLADMVGALSRNQAANGLTITVLSPLYRGLVGRFPDLHPTDWRFDLRIGKDWQSGRFWESLPAPNLRLLFVEHAEFFDRPTLYGDTRGEYPDNAERYCFLSHAGALLARHLPDPPHWIHGHDWQAGLLPLLVSHRRRFDGWIDAPRTMLTIHNLAYQGIFPLDQWDRITGLPQSYLHLDGAEFFGNASLLKAGLVHADVLTTVSPHYAREITTQEYGCGMEGLLTRRRQDLHGILNGVDYAEWNTQTNPHLRDSYGPGDLAGKARVKAALQAEIGLEVRADRPLFVNISRLEGQKGSDFLLDAFEQVLGEDWQLAILGTGNPLLEAAVRRFAGLHPGRIAAEIRFDAALAHRLEAAADFFVMPSRFEPCGLNQLYSLRYGAVPIVRDTGGLHDSVVDIRESSERPTGIKFGRPDADALAHALRKALAIWRDSGLLDHFRWHGMTADFSWQRSVAEYQALYELPRDWR